MIKTLLVAAVLAAGSATLSPETRALIAPVSQAVDQVEAELAALPLAHNDRERLLRMRQLEQAPRAAFAKIDFSKVPQAERAAAFQTIGAEFERVDRPNQAALLAMLPASGWFTISQYGREASEAAFLIVQHGDPAMWRRFVPVLEPLAATGEIKGGDYALMFDRLAVSEKKPQRYGSQMHCEASKLVPYEIEDPAGLDARRVGLGMTPYADYLRLYAERPPC